LAHTYADVINVTCPHCDEFFYAELWLIVDAVERPDLLARIRDGSIHRIVCPQCSHQGQVDAPLLIYRPDMPSPIRREPGRGTLLFSPAQQTTNEEDREQVVDLLSCLKEALEDTWRDEWVEQMLIVPHPFLAGALSDDPKSALRQMTEQAEQALEEMRQQDPEAFHQMTEQADQALEEMRQQDPEAFRQMTEQADQALEEMRQQDPEAFRQMEEVTRQAMTDASLLQNLQEFVQAGTWLESQHIIEQHPELLGDEAGLLLDQLLETARELDNENAVYFLEEHRDLLQRCRDVGVELAFAEQIGA